MRSSTRRRSFRCLLGATTAALIGVGQASQACALEPMIGGGFSVSHPASINVAVAVANARRDGLLPKASNEPVPNTVQLRTMLADLRQLSARLDGGRKEMSERPRSFSMVLVGPGLWSHFHVSSAAILPRYHTKGPLDGKTVVLTHHVVLQQLLRGDLSVEKAAALGLITYSGASTDGVRQLFSAGITPSV